MNVEIRRKLITQRSTSGEMWIDGQFECYTLEPAPVNPIIPGHPSIPAGIYKVQLSWSRGLGYVTPEVLDVPGRSGIRWHIANKPEELEGCAAVGDRYLTDLVLDSKLAFNKMMFFLKTADRITAVYSDPPVPPDVDGEIAV